jgi:hypothetical protein
MKTAPPDKIQFDKLVRDISTKLRVTRFQIKWSVFPAPVSKIPSHISSGTSFPNPKVSLQQAPQHQPLSLLQTTWMVMMIQSQTASYHSTVALAFTYTCFIQFIFQRLVPVHKHLRTRVLSSSFNCPQLLLLECRHQTCTSPCVLGFCPTQSYDDMSSVRCPTIQFVHTSTTATLTNKTIQLHHTAPIITCQIRTNHSAAPAEATCLGYSSPDAGVSTDDRAYSKAREHFGGNGGWTNNAFR